MFIRFKGSERMDRWARPTAASGRVRLSVTNEPWIENPVIAGSIQIKGEVGGLNTDSDWNGADGDLLNKLWDSHTDVFGNGQFLAARGGLSYRVRYSSQTLKALANLSPRDWANSFKRLPGHESQDFGNRGLKLANAFGVVRSLRAYPQPFDLEPAILLARVPAGPGVVFSV